MAHRRARLTPLGRKLLEHKTAAFIAPAGALVTLRTHATDAAGGSITETITSAYKTAP